MERLGINATFNAGAIYLDGRYILAVRVEGYDRKSFFAIAESPNGVDNFRFWDYPLVLPETTTPDTNVYDMRLVAHEDGWIYGLFCTERKDRSRPSDTTAAVASCGIARTKDLRNWERLPDLRSDAGQQRNVVLHPEYIDGKYALYTRPQDGFIEVGQGGGIGWGLTDTMEAAEVKQEIIVDGKVYHTIKELKNGQGPAPLKTKAGWLHLAHGVRNTAAGLRYVLYTFMTSLESPWIITHAPGGYFIAPEGGERVGDAAHRAFQYLNNHFLDVANGGYYWMVDYLGQPTDFKKQIYGQAFAIYALGAYYELSADERAANLAIELIWLIEKYSYDNLNGGYRTPDGTIWLGTEEGLNQLVRKGGEEYFVRYELAPDGLSGAEYLAHNFVYEVIPSSYHSNTLWLATSMGVKKVSYGIDEIRQVECRSYMHDDPAGYNLSHPFVSDLIEESDSTLWVATYDGLNHLNTRSGKCEAYFAKANTPHRLTSNVLQCLYEDKLGNIWLLDIRKNESGLLKLSVSEVDLVKFLLEICDSFNNLATQRDIHLEFHSEQDQLMVWADLHQLEKVIFNLLSNAFKFTKDKGKVLVAITEEEDQIQVEISDSGIGIPPEELHRIFDRFYQASSNTEWTRKSGSGIGLSLAKAIVEKHKGAIEVKSTLAEGTSFRILLRKGKEHFSDEELDTLEVS
eukprot:g172.t1